jgi:tRNA (guanosine-2'-O-)-methyltransferase
MRRKGMDQKELISRLAGFISERRVELFERVLDYRTRYITVVLEDVCHSQNASAVLRSCECFGVQDVHIIENRHAYRVNPDVVRGASKWLNIFRYKGREFNTPDAVEALRQKDYRIIATTCREGAMDLQRFDIMKGKFALFFGTERTGLSQTLLELADEQIRIPIHGFTDSFNLSVSAAITLHHLTLMLHRSPADWKLDQGERDEILIRWMIKSIKHLRGKSPESIFNPH